jgi:hypothetical protein
MTAWTEERKRKQAEAIRKWKPWEKSTGPKTAEGKDRSRMNALKADAQARKEALALCRLNREFLLRVAAFDIWSSR